MYQLYYKQHTKKVQLPEVRHFSMEIFIIVFIIILVIAVGVFVFWKIRNRFVEQNIIQQNNSNISTISDSYSLDDLQIKFEMLTDTNQIDETRLMEITDNQLLAHMNNLMPRFFQAGTTIGNAVQDNSQVLYQAIIPAGVKLTESKDMAGAVRGIYRGANGIQGHANLVAVNKTASIATNTAASAMGIASMIVGQYYMTQINTKLSEISDGISRIANFQDNEYKSKVFALIAQIKKISSFQADILDNYELRTSEIDNLNDWEHECMELLGQANLTIVGFARENELNFSEYEERLPEIQNWYTYQGTLLEVLYRIADLKYALHFGSMSIEQCRAILPTYTKQVKDAAAQLAAWHEKQIKKFGIDIDSNIRKRMGFDGFIHKLPGLINDEYNYRPISNQTTDVIAAQISAHDTPDTEESYDLFQNDVRVIAKGGKVYYLPSG